MKPLYIIFLGALFSLIPAGMDAQAAASLDSTFSQDGLLHFGDDTHVCAFYSMALQPDGKILNCGYYGPNFYASDLLICRFNADGSPDPTFGVNGFVLKDISFGTESARQIAVLPDGKILVMGNSWQGIVFLKLNPDGSPDDTFGANGLVTAYTSFSDTGNKMLVQADGRILVFGSYFAGNLEQSFIRRFKPDGTDDLSFSDDGILRITLDPNLRFILESGVVQPDGKIVGTGRFGLVATAQWPLIRLLPDGTFDDSFGQNGVVFTQLGVEDEFAGDLLLLPDGKIVVGGGAQKPQVLHFTLVRYNTDGAVDNSFGFGGKAQLTVDCCYSAIFSLASQADGKIVACGYGEDNVDTFSFAVARFKPNGIADNTFGEGGKQLISFNSDFIRQMAVKALIQPDGKILVSGFSSNSLSYSEGVLCRFNPGTVVSETQEEPEPFADVSIYPNPANSENTSLGFSLDSEQDLSVSLFSPDGRKVYTCFEEKTFSAGKHMEKLQFPAGLNAGVYVLRIETGATIKSVRIAIQ